MFKGILLKNFLHLMNPPPLLSGHVGNKGAGTNDPNALERLDGWTPNEIRTCGCISWQIHKHRTADNAT